LNSLTELILYDNQVSDLSPLKALKNLTGLHLRYNESQKLDHKLSTK